MKRLRTLFTLSLFFVRCVGLEVIFHRNSRSPPPTQEVQRSGIDKSDRSDLRTVRRLLALRESRWVDESPVPAAHTFWGPSQMRTG